MLSREDYLNYVEEISSIEKKMVRVYSDYMKKIDYPSVKRVCSDILQDEKRHVLVAYELKKLIS
jgi:rubrerythrin